jgi:hypothetical protein
MAIAIHCSKTSKIVDFGPLAGITLPNVCIKFKADEYSHAFDLEKNVYTTWP